MASLSGAVEGAGTGASVGSVGGGWGAAIGGVVGGIAGLFKKKEKAVPITSPTTGSGSTSSPTGFTDAFTKGLSSLFGGGFSPFGGGSGTVSQTNNQAQNISQQNEVNVNNVLGNPFGGFDATTGQFDDFKLLSDVFAIKAAQDGSVLSSGASVSGSTPAARSSGFNPIFLILGGGVALYYLTKGKK